MGHFHVQSSKIKINSSQRRKFYYLIDKDKNKMDPFVRRQINPKIKSFYKEVRKNIDAFDPPRNLPKGHIHVDVKPDNELFIGNKLTGIIDFGIAYPGPLLLDIARTMIINCSRHGELNTKLCDNFLRGYSKYRKLTALEKNSLTRTLVFITYAMIYVDMYHVPFGRVHPDFPMHWIKNFLPVAHQLKKEFSI